MFPCRSHRIPCLCLRAQHSIAAANLLNLKISAGRTCKQLRSGKINKGRRRNVMSTHSQIPSPLWLREGMDPYPLSAPFLMRLFLFGKGCLGIRESGSGGLHPLSIAGILCLPCQESQTNRARNVPQEAPQLSLGRAWWHRGSRGVLAASGIKCGQLGGCTLWRWAHNLLWAKACIYTALSEKAGWNTLIYTH